MIWPLIIISYSCLFVFGITDNARGPLFSEILRYFHVSNSTGALLFAISSLSGFLISFLSIFIFRNIERKKLILSANILMVISLLGLGFSPSFTFFVISSCLFGLSSGMLGLFPNILVPIGSTIEKRQQLIAGLHAMYGVASLLAPLLVALIYSCFHNFHYLFLSLTIFPILLFIYTLKIDSELLERNRNNQTSSGRKNFFQKKTLVQMFLAISLSFTVIAEVMLSSRLALFMENVHHKDIKGASFDVSLFFFLMLIGRTFFAIKKFRASVPTQLTILGSIVILLIYLGVKSHPLYLVFTGLFVAPYYPLMASYIAEQFPHDLDQAMSIMIGLDSMMLTSMHLFIGRLTDKIGIGEAILSGCFFMMTSLLLINIYRFFIKNRISNLL